MPVGSPNVLNTLATTIKLHHSGYLYIWVSNETQNWMVFFDNLRIEHFTGPMIEVGVDALSGGEGGELIRVGEKVVEHGLEIAAEEETKEIAEKEVEQIELHHRRRSVNLFL